MTKSTMTSKCISVAAQFEGFADAPEQYRWHCPMRHVQGYFGNHWTQPSGNYSLCIAPAATMATGKQTTINKYTHLLCWPFWWPWQCASTIPRIPPNLVGKSAWNSTEFHDYSNSGSFELRNFHRNFIFLIVKCVPANSEHVSASLESSLAIDSSNIMNWKTFLLYISVASGIKF
jgi:hypothetical protein